MNFNFLFYCFARALCVFVFSFTITNSHSQGGLCPSNLDFEKGDFTNWECLRGYVIANGGMNVLNISPTSPGDVHTIIDAKNQELDPYGRFPKSCPNGSGYSIMLGNNIGGHEAEGLSYTFTIPVGANRFSIIYNYAVVLQNPNHLANEQPRFRAKITDVNTNSEISCVSFDFTASSSLPGFTQSPIAGDVLYKNWTPITVDLSRYAGKMIRLEFITSDCTFMRHFGYAYIDVNSNCSGTFIGSTMCEGDTSVSLTAPFGFQNYQWYSNDSFTNLIGNDQVFSPNPAPTVGTTYPVIVTPYDGFGCTDTLYATITTGPKPRSNAGADKIICSKQSAQIGTAVNPDYFYSWTPVSLLNNPAVANPYVSTGLLVPAQFIVKTTNVNTGCFSFDSTIITPKFVDTSSSFSGKQLYCPAEAFNNTFTVNNSSSFVQWYRNYSSITGATSLSYEPISGMPGNYWAEILQNGCIDSTKQYKISLSPLPKVNFIISRDVQCINSSIPFTNASTIATNDAMNYSWKFSDGISSVEKDVSKIFTTPGYYTAKLIATSSNNCIDSIQKKITILENCFPFLPSAFTPNGDGLNDVIKPYLAGMKSLKRFAIYNRYGNMIFSTTREGEGWNGIYKGTKSEAGVFVWILEYISNDDKTVVQKGTTVLIR
jgi:gliding motility-associated-like protein